MKDYSEKVLAYLCDQFKGISTNDVAAAFAPVLDESYWADTGDIHKLKSETEMAANVVANLNSIIAEIPTLAGIYQSRLRNGISWPVLDHLVELRGHLDDTVNMARIWDNAHTLRGGKNWKAYTVASLIGQAFLDLRHPITFGNRGDGLGPSTKFGRVVDYIFHNDERLWRQTNTHPNWEKPAKAAHKYYKSLGY